MNKLLSSIALLGTLTLGTVTLAVSGLAQTPPPANPGQPQPPSSYYPAPPPLQAPSTQQGAPVTALGSPLPSGEYKVERTDVTSEAEAQLFADARKIVWGRYAKIKGAKPGEVIVTRQGNVWTVKGRIDSVAPGTEGDWATIDGVVERIAPNLVQLKGEVAFRVAKVEKGVPCKVGGTLHFRRSGKSNVWRLAEGDNPCDGAREGFDLVLDKPVEKKPTPAQPKRG
ncbi:MAG: hypothetical protein IKE60_02000 [Reyranella sp.]|jgi:hypothetical protein|uniref:hypothetical protein n=1 Tax=Reyranella sp. TaxID=1929291 RepID=UPI000962301B|nr:hypothetical protein [Reyranella sp.]MBN9536056.1 hypothetical protein [Alphaproteobacteria bacterium]MBR2813393.1 hypothetical protein [Reyranella sp.]OJU35502.1 MAG: hypothetical protein BGN99_27430 [Alphaproteobacteria bacterium 65-37]